MALQFLVLSESVSLAKTVELFTKHLQQPDSSQDLKKYLKETDPVLKEKNYGQVVKNTLTLLDKTPFTDVKRKINPPI